MNKIIINDKTIEFDGDKTILDLARENGFDIPVLCELKNCGNKGPMWSLSLLSKKEMIDY